MLNSTSIIHMLCLETSLWYCLEEGLKSTHSFCQKLNMCLQECRAEVLAEVLEQSSGLVVLERFDVLLCIINELEIHD